MLPLVLAILSAAPCAPQIAPGKGIGAVRLDMTAKALIALGGACDEGACTLGDIEAVRSASGAFATVCRRWPDGRLCLLGRDVEVPGTAAAGKPFPFPQCRQQRVPHGGQWTCGREGLEITMSNEGVFVCVSRGTGSRPAARPPRRWSGRSGGIHFTYGPEGLRAVADGQAFSVCEDAETARCEGEVRYRIESIAGPYVGMRLDGHADCGLHGAPMRGLRTVDARTGQVARLSELFDEAELVRALGRDVWIRKNVLGQGRRAPALRDLEALKAAILDRTGLQLFDFAFILHHLERGRVAVRVALMADGRSVAPAKMVELAVLLPTPEALSAPLRLAATRTEGFLAGRQPALELSCRSATK